MNRPIKHGFAQPKFFNRAKMCTRARVPNTGSLLELFCRRRGRSLARFLADLTAPGIQSRDDPLHDDQTPMLPVTEQIIPIHNRAESLLICTFFESANVQLISGTPWALPVCDSRPESPCSILHNMQSRTFFLGACQEAISTQVPQPFASSIHVAQGPPVSFSRS